MPLYFLMRLQHVSLPLRVERPEEIKYVSVLKATGLIEADIPPLDPTSDYVPSQVAMVHGITQEGVAELNRWLREPAPRQRTARAREARSHGRSTPAVGGALAGGPNSAPMPR